MAIRRRRAGLRPASGAGTHRPAQGEQIELALPGRVQELEPAVHVLDQARAALDPVAVIETLHAPDDPHLGLVDVAADHARDRAPARLGGERLLKHVTIA